MNRLQNSCLGFAPNRLAHKHLSSSPCFRWDGYIITQRGGRRRLDHTSSLMTHQPTPWGVSFVERHTNVRSSHCLLFKSTSASPHHRQTSVTQCWFNAGVGSTLGCFWIQFIPKSLCSNERMRSQRGATALFRLDWPAANSMSGGRLLGSTDHCGNLGDASLPRLSDQITSLWTFTSVPWFIWRWVGRSEFDCCPLMVRETSIVTVSTVSHFPWRRTPETSFTFLTSVCDLSSWCGASRFRCHERSVSLSEFNQQLWLKKLNNEVFWSSHNLYPQPRYEADHVCFILHSAPCSSLRQGGLVVLYCYTTQWFSATF